MNTTPNPGDSLFGPPEAAGDFQVLAPRLLPVGWEHWERYEILGLQGEGGMGLVFKARDSNLKRVVALKFLRYDDPALAHRLSLEAQIQAGLDHENIVKVYETGEFQGSPYIAMQFIDGVTLDRLDHLDLEARVMILAKVARALHEAHEQGLVHRDLKPANILVERQDQQLKPYLVDFGLARYRSTSQVTTKLMGTLAYMAPEQADSRAPLDERTDVHALGAMLYTFQAGHPPFVGPDGQGDAEVLRRLLYEEAPPLTATRTDRTRDLETIALKSLEKDPNRRYPSALHFAEELERWLHSQPILARPVYPLERLGKALRRLRRNPLAFRSTLALGYVIVTFGAWMGLLLLRSRRQNELNTRISSSLLRVDGLAGTARLLPPHDLRSDRAKIQGVLADVARLARPYGGLARGPLRFVEGRAHMALQQYEEARKDLEAAWQEGYRTPEVAEALGLALLQVHRQKIEEAHQEPDPKRRAALPDKIHRAFRDPALAYLAQATGGAPWEQAYRQALVLGSLERTEEAIAELDRALAQEPLAAELLKLKADLHFDQYH